MELSLSSKVQGWYKVDVVNRDGTIVKSTDWFPNLITNIGLERMATAADYLTYCQVGSDTTTPLVTDTGLVSRIASSSTSTTSNGTQSVEPYYSTVIKTFTFAEGVATGNISELGIGWAATGSLFSRALITDISENPTTIKVLADERLIISYQLRLYPPTEDVTGTLTIYDNVHTWTARAAGVTNSKDFAYSWSLPATSSTPNQVSANAYTYNGPIGEITSTPSGVSGEGTLTARSYVAGSLERSARMQWGYTSAVYAEGIQSIGVTIGWASFQIGITPPIMKTADYPIIFSITYSWARKEI